jgi:glycosyltransferase involved in cell wall biosynthesis
MRVALISHAMTVRSTWSKSEVLRQKVDLCTIIPHDWQTYGVDESAAGVPEGFRRLPCVFPGRIHFHFHRGVGRFLDEFRPDLVHLDQEPYSIVTFRWAMACRRRRIPYLVFTWQNIFKRYPVPFRWMEKWVLSHAAGLVCGNSESVEVFRRKGYRGPIWTIPQFGVEEPETSWPPREYRKLRVGFVGRLVEEKGVSDLIAALSPVSGSELVLIGDGDDREALLSRARALPGKDRVDFLGPMHSEKVREAIGTLDVLVLPSRTRSNWKEQFGRVLVEAMAEGVAVIGSSSGAIPEVVGEAGLIFEEGNVEALTDAIQKMADPAIRASYGSAGRARFRKLYTQEQVCERYAEAYRQILSHAD